MRKGSLAALGALVLLSAACGSDDPTDEGGLPRRTLPPPTDTPYVSVAVDNHFHDIHVEDNITIAFEQGFIVKNQGSNLHNVTIPELDFNEDIEPGEQVEFLDDTMAPGTYSVVCKYHGDQGMVGKLIIE